MHKLVVRVLLIWNLLHGLKSSDTAAGKKSEVKALASPPYCGEPFQLTGSQHDERFCSFLTPKNRRF